MVDEENRLVEESGMAARFSEEQLRMLGHLEAEGIPLEGLQSNPSRAFENPGITLPPEVIAGLSYTAWTALSTAILDGYVEN